MRALSGSSREAPMTPLLVVLGAMSFLAFAVAYGLPALQLGPVCAAVALTPLTYRSLLAWRSLFVALLLLILFVPIRRYTVPGHLPFQLEPYRLLVLFIAAGWLSSLLVDPRVRARLSGLEPPLALFAAAIVASIAANPRRIHDLHASSEVVKKLTFFVSFFLVFVMLVSLLRRSQDVDRLVAVLVGGSAVLALLGLVESRTGYNLFDHLSSVLPFLKLTDTSLVGSLGRGGHHRVYGSSQHPIAFGALLVMIVPLSIYLARKRGQRRWWLAVGVLLLGTLATVSRTGIVMLVVTAVVFVRHRRVQPRRLLPLVVPFLVAAHLALPGTLATIKQSFFPAGGLVQQQKDVQPGSGRLASLGPGLHEWSLRPVLGEGFGTRIVTGPNPTAIILDDEWLSTLLETGLLGALALLWLFVRFARRLGRAARKDDTHRGWLLTALVASVTAYAVGMLFYDAFSFIQVTIVMFVILALGAAATARQPDI